MDYRAPKSITAGLSYLSLPSQEEGQQQLSDLKLLARHKLGRRYQGHTSSQKNTCCSPDAQQELTPRSCQCCIQTRGRNGWDHQRNIYWPNSCFSTCPVSQAQTPFSCLLQGSQHRHCTATAEWAKAWQNVKNTHQRYRYTEGFQCGGNYVLCCLSSEPMPCRWALVESPLL